MIENEIPIDNLEEMEPRNYADGDFDLGVWEDEIIDMKIYDTMFPDQEYEEIRDTDRQAYRGKQSI